MNSRRRLVVIITAAIVGVVVGGFFVQREITTSTFNWLESAQTAQDAQRFQIALDGEVRELHVGRLLPERQERGRGRFLECVRA